VAYPQHSDTDSAGPHRTEINQQLSVELRNQQEREFGSICEDVADAKHDWLPFRRRIDDFGEDGEKSGRIFGDVKSSLQQQAGPTLADASVKDVEGFGLSKRIQQERNTVGSFGWWRTEPDVGRVANGVPFRVDRLKGLGNAVVPQIPEIIGRAILATAYRSEEPRSE
jgi:hypothetical protein